MSSALKQHLCYAAVPLHRLTDLEMYRQMGLRIMRQVRLELSPDLVALLAPTHPGRSGYNTGRQLVTFQFFFPFRLSKPEGRALVRLDPKATAYLVVGSHRAFTSKRPACRARQLSCRNPTFKRPSQPRWGSST